jgi:TonB family protein
MFETYLIHQQGDPETRKRFTFAVSLAVAATLTSGMALFATEKMNISKVSAPKSDFLIFSLDELEPPPPPQPPAAPAAATPEPPDVDDIPTDDVEEQPPDEVPTDLPKRRSTGDVLKNIGGPQGNPLGFGTDPTSTCIVGCGPQIKQKQPSTGKQKPPPEVDFAALTCRVCPDPPQKDLQRTSAALMGKRGLSNRTRFCVESDGRVASVSTRRSSGDGDVDRVIKQTVKGWRFAPMRVDGRARKACSVYTFDIRFE